MIPIPSDIAAEQRILAGDPTVLDTRPVAPWHESRLAFLADLSKRLLAEPSNRKLADVVTFAYWCRRANLETLKTGAGSDGKVRSGIGLVFHICPSNVPVNFAFSMAFGLLSGNSSVLRLPSEDTPTAAAIVAAVADLLETPEHAALRDALLLVRYERNDDVTAFWCAQADGRITWGGDETVRHVRSFPMPPRAREVSFADRYSLCLLDPGAVLDLAADDLTKLCDSLYNDIYLMDQAACSSPQLVVWIGDDKAADAAKEKLWAALVERVRDRYEIKPIHIMDKFVRACGHAANNEAVRSVERHGNVLYRIELDALGADQDEWRAYSGSVHEITLPSLADLAPAIHERYQTLTYFGYDPGDLADFVTSHRLRGIDRVVPVGQALDMDVVWDGYDIVSNLSRIIDVR